jgi:hypothetical protein
MGLVARTMSRGPWNWLTMRVRLGEYYPYLLTLEYGPGGTYNEPGTLELVDDEDKVDTILTS